MATDGPILVFEPSNWWSRGESNPRHCYIIQQLTKISPSSCPGVLFFWMGSQYLGREYLFHTVLVNRYRYLRASGVFLGL